MALQLNELRNMVEDEIINPSIATEIENLIHSRETWRNIANGTETIGNILVAIGAMMAFAAGFYDHINSLAFVAGCLSTASISFLKFSNYAGKESIERNEDLNVLLRRIGINAVYESNNPGDSGMSHSGSGNVMAGPTIIESPSISASIGPTLDQSNSLGNIRNPPLNHVNRQFDPREGNNRHSTAFFDAMRRRLSIIEPSHPTPSPNASPVEVNTENERRFTYNPNFLNLSFGRRTNQSPSNHY